MMVADNSVYQSGGIVMQPVIPPPPSAKESRKIPKSKIKAIPIRIFSILSLVWGISSIGIQIAALVIYTETLSYSFVYNGYDVISYGIWGGSLYVVAGSLGLASTNKRTKGLMIGTVVMSSVALAASIAAAVLSGLNAGGGYYYYCDYYGYSDACESWYGLEWTLFAISVAAFLSLIPLLVLASVSLCCGRKNTNTPIQQQQPYFLAGNGQPIYYQAQPASYPQQQLIGYQQPVQQPQPLTLLAVQPNPQPVPVHQHKPIIQEPINVQVQVTSNENNESVIPTPQQPPAVDSSTP